MVVRIWETWHELCIEVVRDADSARQRLLVLALEAQRAYGIETAPGWEPAYPAWTDDLLKVLDYPYTAPKPTNKEVL